MTDDDSDSDEWGTEELVIPSQKNNLQDESTKNDEDDDWEIKLEKKTSTSEVETSENSKNPGEGEPMIIVDITKIDSNIHSKHDRNSVNDPTGASALRKKIEDDYEAYSKNPTLLSNGTIIPCGSSVWQTALIRLRNERPGHYFAPLFPSKKKK